MFIWNHLRIIVGECMCCYHRWTHLGLVDFKFRKRYSASLELYDYIGKKKTPKFEDRSRM